MTTVATVAMLLAHQGGWDEILLVAAPILVIVAALALVKKRVNRASQTQTAPTDMGSADKAPSSTNSPS